MPFPLSKVSIKKGNILFTFLLRFIHISITFGCYVIINFELVKLKQKSFMKSNFSKLVLFVFVVLTGTLPLLAQAQKAISGKVISSANGQTVASASVIVKGAKNGASTSAEGTFTITANVGDVLVISGVGIKTLEYKVTASASQVISVDVETRELSEVVVTALGIKKEAKRLGYSIQEVKGADLVKAREPNAINSLVGKVAGLAVGASPEILGRPQVLLRGIGVNFYVVDGVPINSDTWNISPDDIESFSILKGPTASALYGNRAINGAIIINTKKGTKDKRGFSVEFNSSVMVESGFNAIPKVQDDYGPGDHGKYAFADGRGGGLNDGDYDIWGPKFEGQSIPQYDSPIDPITGKRTGTPWIARGKNNLDRFIQPGLLNTTNIAVSASNEKSDIRFSLTHTGQKGIVPNTQLDGINFNSSIGYNFSPKLRFDANINYSRQFTPNVPDVNYGPNSMIYNVIIWGGADWNIDDMKNYWQPGKEGVQQIYAEYQRYNNPWFLVKEWLRGHYKNDFYGYMTLNYKVTKDLEITGRSSVTSYDLFRSEKFPYSATSYGREEARGDYREDDRKLFENNTEVLAKYNKNFFKGLNVSALAGANMRTMKYNSNFVSTNYLNVPGIYSFANSRNPVVASNFASEMIVGSVYGSVDVSLWKYLNLSATIRNDKSSAIPGSKGGTYPSLSASTVLTDYLELPSAISFLKFKAAYANVRDGGTVSFVGPSSYPVGYGSAYTSSYDGPSYNLVSNVYSTPLNYNNTTAAYYTDNLYDDIRTASRTNYETGFEIRFLKNRLAIEPTIFQYIDGPQIFRNPISQTTGYTGIFINAAKYATKGMELVVSGTPIMKKDFTWDVNFNWGTYRQTYAELPADSIQVGALYVKKGDRLDIYQGNKFVRTPDGQIVNDAGGRPIVLPKSQFIGYSSPDWSWGFINKFRYKGVTLSIQFDGRVGGQMENYIRKQTFRGGRHIETIQGKLGAARYQDYLGVKTYVGEGVKIVSGTPKYDAVTGKLTNAKELTFAPNDIKTYAQDYVSRFNGNTEGNLMSKTFSKLREITLGYSLSPKMISKTPFKTASISFVARNLFYFVDKKHNDVDLDQYAGSQNSTSLQSPTVKRFGFNLNLVF
jgi:TonB-linked SusC/RagA family outer membrane protein